METYLLIAGICLACFLCVMILRHVHICQDRTDDICRKLEFMEKSIGYLETQNDLNLKGLNAVNERLEEVHSDVKGLSVCYNALVKGLDNMPRKDQENEQT